MTASPDAIRSAVGEAAQSCPVSAAAIEAALAAIEAAPAPGWLVTASAVHANRAAARWAQAVDRGLPDTAGPLPPEHTVAGAVRRAALQSVADGGSAPLALGPLAQDARISGHALGDRTSNHPAPTGLAPAGQPAPDVTDVLPRCALQDERFEADGRPPALPLVAWLQPAGAVRTDDSPMLTERRSPAAPTTRGAAERIEAAAGLGDLSLFERDAQDRFIQFDGVLAALYGVAPGQPMPAIDEGVERVLPEDRERFIEARARMRVTDDPVHCEYRARAADGSVRVLLSWRRRRTGAQGAYLGEIGVLIDITERRSAERRARETADRLQLAALGAGIGSWERSFDGERGTWDAQMYKLFGATPGDGDPHTVSRRCVLAQDRAAIDRAREAALRSGEFAVTYRIRRGDGQIRWLSGRGRTRYGADGAPLSIVGVTWDITEARAAEAALRDKETAEQANRAKSEFLSRMSHELRTPLNAIVGFTQLLELDAGDPLSITQRERVGLIRSSGWLLLNLINDVLDLARIESGKSAVAMAVVAWRPVLEEVIAMVQPQAGARGIVIETRSDGDLPDSVWADPVRLRQVLLNLLSNAVKYNRERGSVQVGVRIEGNTVSLTVRDTGRGMSPGQLSRLFEPFSRLGIDSTTPAGTGIGLAISQRLMQQMEGAIEVDSTPGIGSEFHIRLRAACMEQPQAAALPAAAAPALSVRDDIAGTLLYIEDNPANSALVEQFLQFRPRIRLYQATDGATGLVMAAVCRPDLALIDIRLPDMMGDEVMRQMRQQPETRDVPCVAVSANAMPRDIEAALAAGFVDYWTKPLDVTHFLRGIDRLLTTAEQPPVLTGARSPA